LHLLPATETSALATRRSVPGNTLPTCSQPRGNCGVCCGRETAVYPQVNTCCLFIFHMGSQKQATECLLLYRVLVWFSSDSSCPLVRGNSLQFNIKGLNGKRDKDVNLAHLSHGDTPYCCVQHVYFTSILNFNTVTNKTTFTHSDLV
jgi:hypothetical protein